MAYNDAGTWASAGEKRSRLPSYADTFIILSPVGPSFTQIPINLSSRWFSVF